MNKLYHLKVFYQEKIVTETNFIYYYNLLNYLNHLKIKGRYEVERNKYDITITFHCEKDLLRFITPLHKLKLIQQDACLYSFCDQYERKYMN